MKETDLKHTLWTLIEGSKRVLDAITRMEVPEDEEEEVPEGEDGYV